MTYTLLHKKVVNKVQLFITRFSGITITGLCALLHMGITRDLKPSFAHSTSDC